MTETQDAAPVEAEELKRYGMKWAVLAAMRADMANKGVKVPASVDQDLTYLRVKIVSGCFSTCDVGFSLSKVESELIPCCHTLGEGFLRGWSDLLAKAMKGEIDPNQVAHIPALKPVASDCRLIGCKCAGQGV